MVSKVLKIKCPYCGKLIHKNIKLNSCKIKKIITCALEKGQSKNRAIDHCGKDFVVNVHINFDVNTLKIEGEENKR